jgi:hypothetical protein
LLAFLVSGIVVSAAILGFFLKSTTSVTTDNLFLIDDMAPDELLLTNTVCNAVGGNVYLFGV